MLYYHPCDQFILMLRIYEPLTSPGLRLDYKEIIEQVHKAMCARMFTVIKSCHWNPPILLVGMSIGAATVESSMEVPQKTKNRNTIWLSNSTSGNLPEENKIPDSKRYIHPYVYCCITYNSRDTDATWVSINRWMDKKWYIHTMEYYSSIKKKKEILPFATTCMDLEGIMLWNKPGGEREIPYDFTYLWNINTK